MTNEYALLGYIDQNDSRPNVEILKFSDNIEELKEIRELLNNFKTGQEEDLTKEEIENNNKIIQELSKFEEMMSLQDEITRYYFNVVPTRIIKIINKNEEFFDIPHMCIHRDDIKAQYYFENNYKEIKEKISKLSDKQMQLIASKMSDTMMEQFNISLREACESFRWK